MIIKSGANIQGISLKLRPVLVHADKIWKDFGHELVITAGLNGTHSAGSLHYYGLALDLRSNYFTKNQVQEIVVELHTALGNDYDIVVHDSHIHVEYDVAI